VFVPIIRGTVFNRPELVRWHSASEHDLTVLHRRGHHVFWPAIHNVQADRSDVTRPHRRKTKEILLISWSPA
jgi:hypothetical protein